jgi:hypothetical protein
MSQSTGLNLGAAAIAILIAFIGFIGVLVGAYVASRNQRQLWIADNKRSEYRKLLTTMARTFNGIVKIHAFGGVITMDKLRLVVNLESRSNIVLLDRLFIDNEVKKMKLVKRWNQALREYADNDDHKAFSLAFSRISQDIREAAADIIKEEDWLGWIKESKFWAEINEMQTSQK